MRSIEKWYKYRDDLYKQVTVNNEPSEHFKFTNTEQVNDTKTADNIRRAQRCIEDYALCNPWDWFCTFTISPEKYDRSELSQFRKDFTQFIRHMRRKYPGIGFLLVPELHKKSDGWHIHGFLLGIPVTEFRHFTLHEKLPTYIRQKLKAGEDVFDWAAYRSSFGFVDIEPVRNRDAAARYVTKYVTKSLDGTAKHIKLQKHLYFVSQGLLKPIPLETEKASGSFPDALPAELQVGNRYEWLYGSVQWFIAPKI